MHLTIEYNDDGAVDFIFNDDESEQSPFCRFVRLDLLLEWLDQKVMLTFKRGGLSNWYSIDDLSSESNEDDLKDSISLHVANGLMTLEFHSPDFEVVDEIPFIRLNKTQVESMISDLHQILEPLEKFYRKTFTIKGGRC